MPDQRHPELTNLVREIPWREWREFAGRPRSMMLIGFLSCPPCLTFKNVLGRIADTDLAEWEIGWAAFPPREGNRLIAEGEVREIPTLFVRGTLDRGGRISGLRSSDAALQSDIKRLALLVTAP